MVLIISNSRKGTVRQQKQIIDYIDKHSDRHGTDSSINEALHDYEKVCHKGGLTKAPVVFKR